MRERGQPCPWCRGDVKWRTDETSSNIVSEEEIARRLAADEELAQRLARNNEDWQELPEAANDNEESARIAADEEFARALAANMVNAAPVPPPQRFSAAIAQAPDDVPELPDGIKQVIVPSADALCQDYDLYDQPH